MLHNHDSRFDMYNAHGPADFLREVQQIDDEAADDPTLRLLGFDYLIGVAKDTEAATNIQAAQVKFEARQFSDFRQEMIIAARKLGLDVFELPAFQHGKVQDNVIFRMVVQLATRALDRRLGFFDGPFAGLLGSRLVH